jgi:hypothetical protein
MVSSETPNNPARDQIPIEHLQCSSDFACRQVRNIYLNGQLNIIKYISFVIQHIIFIQHS